MNGQIGLDAVRAVEMVSKLASANVSWLVGLVMERDLKWAHVTSSRAEWVSNCMLP